MTMNTISKCTLPCWVVLGILTSETAGAITVECIPISGTDVTGGQLVEVECFLTTDVDQVVRGYTVDLACSLPRLPGASGTIEKREQLGIVVNIGHGGFPSGDFLFHPTFTGGGCLFPIILPL